MQRSELETEAAEVDAEHHGGNGLQHEQYAARHEELVDRRLIEHGSDDNIMQDSAGRGDEEDGEETGSRKRQAECLVAVEDHVHANHHQLGVADPDHVNDAEDEIEAQGQQRQKPGEQHAVDQGLDEEDVERAIEVGEKTHLKLALS